MKKKQQLWSLMQMVFSPLYYRYLWSIHHKFHSDLDQSVLSTSFISSTIATSLLLTSPETCRYSSTFPMQLYKCCVCVCEFERVCVCVCVCVCVLRHNHFSLGFLFSPSFQRWIISIGSHWVYCVIVLKESFSWTRLSVRWLEPHHHFRGNVCVY